MLASRSRLPVKLQSQQRQQRNPRVTCTYQITKKGQHIIVRFLLPGPANVNKSVVLRFS